MFTPVVPAHKMSLAFVRIAAEEQFSPARTLIEFMMPYYEDVDGNFVEQFQSSAFDARFWELYLFALLTEERFVFDRTYSAPDFVCDGLYQGIFVEAVTVGPTRVGNLVIEHEPPDNAEGIRDYMLEYMPIKWAGALTAKLQKEYWKLPHVTGKPIVFAVQDSWEAIQRGSVSGEAAWGGQNQHSGSVERPKTSRTTTAKGPARLALDPTGQEG